MHRFHTSLLAASTMTGLSLCAPTAQGVEVTYRTTFANGTSAKHVVLEPFDSHFVRTVYGQGHSKRAYNTFPGWGDSDEELDRIDKIREAQRDGIELAIAARDNIDTGVAYEDYFGPDDKDKVRQVYDNIIGSNTDGSGSDLLGDVQWDPSDYNNRCTPLGQEADVESVTVAYEGTSNVDGQIRALNHMCDQAYNFKAIRDISCDSLSTTVNTLMNVLGKVMVHEWTHFPPISAPVAEDGTEDVEYDLLKIRNLEPAQQLVNAENYAWYAQEQFWRIECNAGYSGPRDDRDTKDSECGSAKCDVM